MQPTGPERNRAPLVILCVVLVAVIVAGTGTARAAWDEISRVLSLQGKPEPASANVLSCRDPLDRATSRSRSRTYRVTDAHGVTHSECRDTQ